MYKAALKKCEVVLEKVKLSACSDVSDEETERTPRKSVRTRKKPNKFGEFVESPSFRPKDQDEEMVSFEESSGDEDNELLAQKPSALFSKDDVEGQDMFKFKSRHTKNDLQKLIETSYTNSPQMSSPKTPGRSVTGSAQRRLSKIAEATPKHVKDLIRKRIMKEVESDSDETDFSASSDEYVPEDAENETQSSSSESEKSEEEIEETKKSQTVQIKLNKNNRLRHKDTEYIVTPDDYFRMNSGKKVVTSDHTLDRLKNFDINDLEQTIEISDEHKRRITKLNKSYEQLFDRWLYVLSENFNVILYGIGSKRSILHKFQQEKLNNYPCVVVNGFFPGLTLKNILESIVVDLLECSHVPSNISDVVSLIDEELSESNTELFLIVHNIDGTTLRSAKVQSILANLAKIKHVHMIASIDHINAPLLWDHTKLSKFNFTWWDVTTFLPYTEETSYENSLLSHKSSALQLSSLRSVYQSLTSNAKGIYNIIIQYQIDNHKQNNYQGLPFRDLYSKSRENFLASSDIALRAQLTEFLDHKLVKMKRTQDGSENLVIPIDNVLLQQFLDQQNND